MPLLLLKAKVRGDSATGDLFAQPVPVQGHMRGPVYVQPHTAIRHKAPDIGARLEQMQARRDPDGIEAPPTAPMATLRPTYPDGRLIPQPGDKVRRMVPGIFGMPVVLDGVVRGKTVQITSGATNRRQDALTPAWSVVDDPALERLAAERRAKAEAERQAAEARRAAEAVAAEAERAALVAARGTLEGVALTPGEVIEGPEGRLHIVAETDPEKGWAFGYALDGDDQSARGFGRLDGWRRTDHPAPPGAIIESRYGKARRRTAAGGWEDVAWNEETDAWQPATAAPPAPPEPAPPPARPPRLPAAPAPLPVVIPRPAPAPPREDGAELAELRARFARMKPGDRLYDLYRARIEADPSKWRIGHGVTYQVAGARGLQTNRGYRVVAVDPSNRQIAVQLIRDAGYADAMPGDPPHWLWMGDAKRAKADDAPELGPATPKARPAADAPGTIHRAFTADFTSEIHYARDKDGRVWRRTQFRDPRYGYKWSNWKLTKREAIPEGATATDQRARLPAW